MNVPYLVAQLQTRLTNITAIKGAAQACKEVLRSLGIPFVPFGVGNDKTELPGYYRRVGDTCPQDCPLLLTPCGKKGPCYGNQGNVALHQRRALLEVEATIASFVACAVLAKKYYEGKPERMQVAGDLYLNNKVDRPLVAALKDASKILQGLLGMAVVGYGYTHGHDKNLMLEMEEAGMVLLESDYFGPGGAIVLPHDQVKGLKAAAKAAGTSLVKCPAQLSKSVSCADCLLCVVARKKNMCIVFEPHGLSKDKVPSLVEMILEQKGAEAIRMALSAS